MFAMQLDAGPEAPAGESGAHANCPAASGGVCISSDRIEAIRFHYQARDIGPLNMARVIEHGLIDTGLSSQSLARAAGLTPGGVHHYLSLLRDLAPELQTAVAERRLSFKEGRALADIRPVNRQLVAAEPFVAGWLSSVHIERFVTLFKQSTAPDPRDALKSVLEQLGTDGATQRPPAQKIQSPPPKVDPRDVVATALALAGSLDIYLMVPPPEVQRFAVVKALRLLQTRMDKATMPQNGHRTHENGAGGSLPRPAPNNGLSGNGFRPVLAGAIGGDM